MVFRAQRKRARAYGFPAAIWDSGGKGKPGQEKHCYTNHGTGEFLSSGREPIETIVRAWTTEDPAYTLFPLHGNPYFWRFPGCRNY